MRAEGWNEYKLSELCESVSITHKFNKEKLIFLNTGDIEKGKFLHREYSDVKPMPGQAKKSIRKNDILFSEIRPANGRYALVDFDAEDYVVSTKLMVIRGNDKILPKYLYFFLTSNTTTAWLQHLAESRSGTFPQITFDQVADLDINLPPKPVQQRISDFISALDEKSELNRQTKATLEAFAQAIFKEWFVDFNFPGATGEMVESALGMIPRGWWVEEITNELNIVYGKNLPTSKLIEDGYPVFGGNGLIGFYDQYLYEEPQVIVACRGAASGKVNQSLPKSFVTNNSLVFEIPKKSILNFSYLKYFCLNTDFTSFVSGSAQPQLTIESLRNAYLLIPEAQLLRRFSEIASPLESMMLTNNKQSLYLTQVRDALLPKLMSGEIKV